MKEQLQKLSGGLIRVITTLAGFLSPSVAFAQSGAASALGSAASWLTSPLTALIAQFANWLFNLVSWVTSILGDILDYTIQVFIINMSSKIDQISAIDELWRIIRDLSNIIFIFLILYAAISIILNNSQKTAKNTLVRVFVVALFVNFSLFAAQVVIDTSNVFALQIYENISVSGANLSGDVNISEAIAGQLNLSSVQSNASLEVLGDSNGSNGRLAIFRLIATAIVGFVGFIMLAFAALITVRFFVLILLMIGSPIAFVAMAIPDTNFGEKWFSWLISQSFFAPAVMLMLYITLYVGNSMKSDIFGGSGNLATAITQPSGNIDILIFYGTLTGLLVASLLVAKQIGAVGANKAVSYGKSLRNYVGGSVAGGAGYVGRTTAGRAGRYVADKESWKQAEKEGGLKGYIAQQARRAGEATAETSFDVRNTSATDSTAGAGYREGGFDEMKKEEQEFREERRKSIEESSQEEKVRIQEAKAEKKEIEDKKKEFNDEIKDINKAINKRNELQNKLAEAKNNNNQPLAKQLNNQLDQLVQNTKRVSNRNQLNNIENERNRLQLLKEQSKKRQKSLDEVINVAKQRGEEYVEQMSKQASILDEAFEGAKKAANTVRQKAQNKDVFSETESSVSTKTQGRQLFATENVEKIDNLGEAKSKSPKRRQRIIDNLS